ncbi:MAG: hypothetical protein JXR91_13525 [Deltaproteobacteria bacterium]|nr:hypothetical protein [Deltaproteobacteria bacterium]
MTLQILCLLMIQYSIRAETYSLNESLDIDIDFRPGIEWEKGDIISFEQDCATGQEIPDPLIDDFDIYVDRQIDEVYSWCHLSFNYSECSDIIGTVEVVEYSDNGENVELALNNIPMVCYPDESSDREYGYFSGTVSATAIKASTLDYTGLHSLIKDEGLNTDNIPAALTVKNIVNDIYPLRDDIQLAACYAQLATNGGNGPVFTYPSILTGFKDMPISSRDMLALASVLSGGDSLLAIAGSYDVPLHIKKMENMTNTELCEEINTYIGSLKTDNHMSEAKESLKTALKLVIKALELKEDIGIFATNKDTYKGDDVLMEYATAALSSLTDGVIDVPYTAPPVKLNLKALFDNPPDPSKIDADPVVCETEIDGTDEYVYIEAVEVFYKDLLKDIIPEFDFDIDETDFGNKDEDMENSGEQIFIQIDKGIDI